MNEERDSWIYVGTLTGVAALIVICSFWSTIQAFMMLIAGMLLTLSFISFFKVWFK